MNFNKFNPDMISEDKALIENLLKTIIDNNFSSVMLTKADAGYPIVFVNEAFTELTGYEIDEIVGKTPSFLQGPNTDREIIEQLGEKLDNGKIFHGKTINYRKDGTEFMMEWKILPIYNSDNQTTHFLAVQRLA
ncbi:MAG: PAS domain-containing protein [Desulfobacterales bacterium]|nr:PAS domain-containing protein [Desulfobacterales bacterium]